MIFIKEIKKQFKNKMKRAYSLYKWFKNNKIVTNYFNTSFSKNVLICYINQPFANGITLDHTNTIESLEIAKAFKENGYNCDIVSSDCGRKINYEKYDILFGFGEVFKNSFYCDKKITRLYYSTGKHPYFSNQKTIERGRAIKSNKGRFLLESLRYLKEDYLLETNASDALILIGSETESLSYKKYSNVPIYNLNVSFFKIHEYIDIISHKDFSESKKHFLFFSGGGLIHKGLDILLEAFSKQENFELHICAPTDSEIRFKKIYNKELYNNRYIHVYDFINLKSKTFEELLIKCAFVILPSCSEAMPTSVVNVVGNGGLIPILSKDASINIDNVTIPIEELSSEGIIDAVNKSQLLTREEIITMSKKAGQTINDHYSIMDYSKNIKKIIKNILSNNKD